jgi:ribosome maturation factor RimP
LREAYYHANLLKKVGAAHFFFWGAWVENREGWLERVEATILPILVSYGLDLVDTEWQREGRRWVLRFFVDKPGGVTVGDCQAVSREAGDVLDVMGLIEPAYDLEVSSPGLCRELRKDREFAWAVGKELSCWLREPIEGRRELSGRLVAVSGTELTVSEPDGRTTEVPRALVTKARLELAFGRSRPPKRRQRQR